MFQLDDLIVYGSSGVCRVAEIAPLSGAKGADKNRLYYRLVMVHSSGEIFIPVDSKAFMRPIISRTQAEELIDIFPTLEGDLCTERSPRLQTERYHAAFESHRCEDLIILMKSIYAKECAALDHGKQLGLTDQRYKRQAEELVYGELSSALEIPYEAVESYILERLASAQSADAE